jgi:uncharacterized protein (DUF885 family)
MKRLFLAIFPLVVAAGCAPAGSTPEPATTPAAGPAFAKFVDDYFAASFRFNPVAGTDSGLHEYDDQLGDSSRQSYEARIAELHRFLAGLQRIDRNALSFDERIDATAIEHDIRAQLLDLETLRVWQQNPMYYAYVPGSAVGSLIKRDFAPKEQRLRSVISRLRKAPAIFESAKANVLNPPREFTDLAIRMAAGSTSYFEGTVAEWAKDAAGSDAGLLMEFQNANRAMIAASRDFSAWLENDLLPRSNGVYAIGAANFLAKLKYEDMVELPLPELLAKGEAQLQKDYDAFLATAKLIDPNRTPADVMKALSDTHPTAETLLPSVRSSIDDARRYLIERGIVTIPSDVRPRIEETPPYARSGSFASMDTPGPFETRATEAYYYVTPVEPEWDEAHKEEHLRLYNPWVVAMINVHEAYPGHYLQFLYSPRFPTKTRKILFSGTNAEGWAHYSEQMMVDEGFGGGDPRYRLAQLQEALLRDCRYVAGIKLHTSGWTVEQAAKLFEERGFQEPANAFEEARRGTYNPTYLYYTLGKLEIQELRDEYMRKKGASLREFHDAFVSQGALPIPLVRQILLR